MKHQGNDWNFAASTGGIVNTTAVTIAPAVSGQRNFVTALQIKNTSATATEVAIRDGAGGTVIWLTKAPASMINADVVSFDTPIYGSRGNLLEVVCLTTGSATYVNAQGYIFP